MARPDHAVEVIVDPRYGHRCDPALLARCIRAVFDSQRLRAPRAVDLRIADTRTVHRLNARYAGLDEPTDVLSFNTDFPGLRDPDGNAPLGAIIIALPVAAKNARNRGVELADELALLAVHGALHLLGRDHETAAEDAAMREQERRALALAGRESAARTSEPAQSTDLYMGSY